MRSRDAWSIASKLVAVLIARQAVFPLSQLIEQVGLSTRTTLQSVLQIVLFLAIAAILWFGSDRLASFAMDDAAGPATASVDPRQIVGICLALIGIWLIAHGIIFALVSVGDLTNRQRIFSTALLRSTPVVDPFRRQAEWAIAAYAVEAAIGAVLLLFRRPLAEMIVPRSNP